MAKSNDYMYKTLKGSPTSGRTTNATGPKDTAYTKTTKRSADYCGIMDSRSTNSDRRQSAR